MKCPKCGYKRQKRDDAFVPATECPSCGLVYSKHDAVANPGLPISTAGVPPHLRKSAVDPESLKKARDRVEKRLRNRIESRPKEDQRHSQTLELARKITHISPPIPDKRLKQVRNVVIDETTVEQQNPKTEGAEDQPEEALLLNEVVGVQIHNGAQDSSPEALEPMPEPESESETNALSSEDTLAEASTGTDPDIRDAEPVEEQETDEGFVDSRDFDDVQTQTVVLETAVQFSHDSTDQEPEDEAPDILDDALLPEQTDLPPAYIAEASPSIGTDRFGAGLRRMLPIVAWLILFSGVVGAVLSWTTISDVEAGVNIPMSNSPSTLPLGLLLGFAYLATGALGFAFFWVSSLINRQLKDIQQLLMAYPIAHIPEEPATDLPDAYEEVVS